MADIITPPADPGVILRAEAVDLVRGDRLLLDQVTFTVRPGEHWALLGPNGPGPVTEVLTTDLLSTCFDYPVAIARHAGRWASIAR